MQKTLVVLSVCILCMSVFGQTRSFTKDGLEYTLELPSPSWRVLSRLDVHEHVEFINGKDYGNGYLRLSKKLVLPGTSAEDLFRMDEKWELQSLPGYVVCSDGQGAEFKGHLTGKVFSYEYISNGRGMDGRIYYLQLNSRMFYALHFTVASEKLSGLSDQMDSIAHSFRLK